MSCALCAGCGKEQGTLMETLLGHGAEPFPWKAEGQVKNAEAWRSRGSICRSFRLPEGLSTSCATSAPARYVRDIWWSQMKERTTPLTQVRFMGVCCYMSLHLGSKEAEPWSIGAKWGDRKKEDRKQVVLREARQTMERHVKRSVLHSIRCNCLDPPIQTKWVDSEFEVITTMFKKRITNDEDLTWEVRANDSHFYKHKQKKSFMCFRWGQHADNVVRSYKYTFLTFVPLSLYEQFQRLANLYFLFLLLIQSIPVISAVPWFVAIIPLLAVLSVRGLKDLLNDLARRRSDKQINTRKCDILSTKTQSFRTAKWKDVSLGDVLRIHKDEVIPADILLLCSSEAHSLCYVETADIDGETNLKYHQALTDTHEELTTQPSEKSLAAFSGVVICEPPNSRLYNFRGELHWQGQSLPLDTGHVLLRGTTLRNTETIYGLAIYLGADSKIFKNGGKLRLKRTQVEQILNKTVIGIVIVILSSALLMSIGSGWFESNVSSKIESLSSMWVRNDPIFTGFLNFFSYIMLLSAAMPIALYITFDIIHVIHSKFIGWDVEMRLQPTVPAQARNTSLNEELGQVGYLLSDKTGTLTQNKLLFRQCCIAGEIYGDACISAENVKPMDLSWNTYSCGGMAFSAPTLVECLRKNECHLTREFFNGLALCHTVMAEWKKGAPVYQSASPDEEALVGAAREMGFVFLSRTRESLTISEMGITKEYQLLALLDFTSSRRRMSVLVRDPEGALKLYSKGADLVIMERLQMDDPHQETTDKFLELFGQLCLRTLCVAVRSVPEALWGKWSKTLTSSANMVISDREKTLEAVYDDMEKDLQLLGVTAIEDRLQEGVPETIELLRQAGIKIWVLTGDKKETAVNIGYSCKLLDPDTRLLEGQELRQILQSSDPGVSLSKTRQTEMWCVDRETAAEKTALVLTGEQLMDFHRQPEWGASFMRLAQQCQSVVCCRVTPLQKADIVSLVRKHTKSVTMAIGDGANDVNMIKTAHIGVGLVGVEGGQAVQNADFSLAQFRFLQRLLLVHGRWSYRRISFFLRYFLYKTTCFALVHIWYGLYSGYSAQTMYEFWFIPLYTSFYTSYPILSVAIFDQDVGVEESLKSPSLYHAGQKYEHFNFKLMAGTLLYAVYTSLVLFFIPLGVWQDFGRDYQTMAFTVAMGAFFATNTEVMLFIRHWTGWNVASVGISILIFFLGTIITQSSRMFQRSKREYFFIGVSSEAFIDPVMWLTVLLTACLAVLPSMVTSAVMIITRSRHKVHSQQQQQVELGPKAFTRGGRRRSTYACSQGEGMGHIITSGTSLRTAVKAQETEGKDKGQTGDAPPSYDKQNGQPILSEL